MLSKPVRITSSAGGRAGCRGSPSTPPTRPGGILLATEHCDGAEPVNIDAGSEITIKDLAAKIAELAGFEGEIRWDTSKPDGQPGRCLNVTKARKHFGFEARTPLEVGLRETIDWYRAARERDRVCRR